MSILIQGMEMPKNCTGCPICCGLPYQYRDEKGRRPDCPLIELPPHGRLIDADELVRIWTGAKFYGNIKPIVDARPTVIKAEGETDGR